MQVTTNDLQWNLVHTHVATNSYCTRNFLFHSYNNRRMSEPVINKGIGATRVSLPIIYDKFGYYVCYTNDLQENVGRPQATMHVMVCKAIWATRMPQGMVYTKMWPCVCPIQQLQRMRVTHFTANNSQGYLDPCMSSPIGYKGFRMCLPQPMIYKECFSHACYNG